MNDIYSGFENKNSIEWNNLFFCWVYCRDKVSTENIPERIVRKEKYAFYLYYSCLSVEASNHKVFFGDSTFEQKYRLAFILFRVLPYTIFTATQFLFLRNNSNGNTRFQRIGDKMTIIQGFPVYAWENAAEEKTYIHYVCVA